MVRSLLFTIALLLSVSAVIAQSSTVLQGKVTDEGNGEALIGATVKVLKGTDVVRGAIADFDGNYRLSVDPGTYDVEISYTGYATARTNGVKVLNGQINFLDVSLSATILTEVVIKDYKVPLIKQDETSTGTSLTSDQIAKLPNRSVNAIVAATAGTSSIDGGAVNIKGSRSNATNYYIDGIRVAGGSPPVQDIEQISVVTGGLGAEYGDVTGGVIAVITKGPASELNGAIEVENSYGLDPYGWLLANANISGPLLKRKTADGNSKETLLGFRLSGQYLGQKDDDPPALPVYTAKQSVLDNIAAHPLTSIGGTPVPTAETMTDDSVTAMKYRPYESNQTIDLTGKLDLRISQNIDFSVTGTFNDTRDQFDPGGWRLLNGANNPTAYNQRYRGLARFRHRLGNTDNSKDEASANRVSISNTSYQIQFGFDRGTAHSGDKRHEDRLFDYGYMGRFGYDLTPVTDTFQDANHVFAGFRQRDNRIDFTGYQPGYINSNGTLVVPNSQLQGYNEFANPEIDASYFAYNGTLLGTYDNLWSDMYSNYGLVYNSSTKSQSDIITINASSGFDLKLGRTGVHNIQFGLLNEQRILRSYSVAPYALWTLARGLANQHFNGLDYSKPTYKYWDPEVSPLIGDSIQGFAIATVDLPGNRFYRDVRSALGLSLDQYVNVDGLRPDQLNLSMFAPRELTEQNLIGYYGYDYLGNLQDNGVTFNDFFTQKDADGVRSFPVAPLQPLYQAAFIKDKFSFNKMIFSLGLRVERFDLNTKVLRDQYSLYEIMSAGDFHASITGAGVKPANIGDDYKVYVEDGTAVKAYRSGDTWFDADGVQANDGNLIFGGGVVTPMYADTVIGDDIKDERFDPNYSFEDYTPQINWLPRLAFSFPISEDANFFAHYDVLVQRPPSNWQVTPLSYYYFNTPGRTTENNANLLPERVVDYEVGFQQRLNQNSALKFSAYYKEFRDMIQLRRILYVPTIGQYTTFGNVDFGTAKGFTFQYDLRRIQNTQMLISYTLAFADGTGSNAESQRGILSNGNIRTLYPLDFDERHNIQGIIDYRFDAGDKYNGPRIAGLDVLANFGVNLQFNAVSGRPYTSKLRPTRFGGSGTVGAINGNRLPWRFNIDMRIDKSFNLSAEGKKPIDLNIYLRVANVLNRKNVVGVYAYTGSPYDDGYLATPEGYSGVESVAAQGKNPQAFLDAYSWALQNPNNFTIPRRIYLGATISF